MAAFKIILRDKEIDVVYFISTMTESEVKQALVKHDGFSPNIIVKKVG